MFSGYFYMTGQSGKYNDEYILFLRISRKVLVCKNVTVKEKTIKQLMHCHFIIFIFVLI